MYWDHPGSSRSPATALAKPDAITIAEAELINYFKPSENDDYVRDGGKAGWKHIKLLVKNRYGKIRGVLDLEGQYARFYTSHIGDGKSNRHEIDVDLSKYKHK